MYACMQFPAGGYLICTDSSSGDSCPQCFCPNNAIKYTCELERLESTTRWTVPPNLCTQPGGNNWIQLSQAAGCGGNRVTCGAFVAANVAVNGSETPCSVSQLEVTITDQMARARVQCSSINLKGVSLERYESAPITMTSKYFVVLICGHACVVVTLFYSLHTLPTFVQGHRSSSLPLPFPVMIA